MKEKEKKKFNYNEKQGQNILMLKATFLKEIRKNWCVV